jgi:hypothetical protein
MATALKVAAMETTTTETPVKVKGKAKGKAKAKPTTRKLRSGEKIRAGAFFALAICGLMVSLPHLASEVALLTGAGALATWLVAVVIDLGMIVCKAHLSADGHNRVVAWAIVASCTFVSIVLNCHAFLAHADAGFGQVAAVGFGCFLPLFILALSYMGSEILNGKRG